ncbi:twitch domain-containing radical SAM protein [Reichenbachiella ulvae]|uniref:Twitch domain-containing radical SAM protein n=1 Tax=Reichenbachiella ulvae TaxID=2980104 RepID=A0ABT3CQ63_9BACT|nr:twitch domain-containing radical SAM protein [Reichenbachiella ulvae]MCV9385784.1 twitch domain-containing radical SAM protein [Reichenbachiella ulvae]
MGYQYSDQKFCPMPWLHLHVDTQGLIKACCSTSVTFGNLNKDSVSEIWQSKSINDFRQQVIKSGVDKRCAACLNREASGKSSMRTETLARYPDLSQSILDNEGKVDTKPVYLDLRFSNLCNLRCRTCWHGASSSWFKEAKALKNTAADQAIIRATENNSEIIQGVLQLAEEVEEVYFAGGEPLMMEEHYQLLDLLCQSGQQPLLRYNTNLSILKLKNQHVLEFWKEFKKVQLSVSVDEIEERGEYVRKGLKWEVLVDNMRQIKKECPHVKLEIAPTVSVFNVGRLGLLHRYFVEKELISVNDIYLNMLDRPFYYNIVNLSDREKQSATSEIRAHLDWLRENQANEIMMNEFESIISYMNSRTASEKQMNKRVEADALLDKIRGEKFPLIE